MSVLTLSLDEGKPKEGKVMDSALSACFRFRNDMLL